MTKTNRRRSTSKTTVQAAAAKQSVKKKQKQGLKYRNAEVRTVLDSQAQEIYAVTAKLDVPQPKRSAEEAVQSLEACMRNL